MKKDKFKIPKYIQKEIEYWRKTEIPRCLICKKPYVNAIDSITQKKSKYLWKPTCKCLNKNLRLSIG